MSLRNVSLSRDHILLFERKTLITFILCLLNDSVIFFSDCLIRQLKSAQISKLIHVAEHRDFNLVGAFSTDGPLRRERGPFSGRLMRKFIDSHACSFPSLRTDGLLLQHIA